MLDISLLPSLKYTLYHAPIVFTYMLPCNRILYLFDFLPHALSKFGKSFFIRTVIIAISYALSETIINIASEREYTIWSKDELTKRVPIYGSNNGLVTSMEFVDKR